MSDSKKNKNQKMEKRYISKKLESVQKWLPLRVRNGDEPGWWKGDAVFNKP